MRTRQPAAALVLGTLVGLAFSACSGSETETDGTVSAGSSASSPTAGAPGGGATPSTAGASGAAAGTTGSQGAEANAGGSTENGETGEGSVGAGDVSSGSVGAGGDAPMPGAGGERAPGDPTPSDGDASTAMGDAPSDGTPQPADDGTAAGGAPAMGDEETGAGGMPSEPDAAGGAAPVEEEEPFMGTCTASEPVMTNASGSGPHDVVVETNSDPGIDEGTIFRPADMGGEEKYPIFVWGEGACSTDGLSNASAMAEIASYGYFVVADGTPDGGANRQMDRSDMEAMGAPLVAYIDWAIAENDKPCSAYYQGLNTEMIASNGFSCGGLMAQGTTTDPRIVTWGVTSSGMAGATQAFYDTIHTPVLFVEGGPAEVAYDGGLEGYGKISELGVPVLWFSKDIGHGGDLFQPGGGDFTKLNLAWLNWWLKGDEGATGKGLLIGADCPYCSDPAWEVMSANVP